MVCASDFGLGSIGYQIDLRTSQARASFSTDLTEGSDSKPRNWSPGAFSSLRESLISVSSQSAACKNI